MKMRIHRFDLGYEFHSGRRYVSSKAEMSRVPDGNRDFAISRFCWNARNYLADVRCKLIFAAVE